MTFSWLLFCILSSVSAEVSHGTQERILDHKSLNRPTCCSGAGATVQNQSEGVWAQHLGLCQPVQQADAAQQGSSLPRPLRQYVHLPYHTHPFRFHITICAPMLPYVSLLASVLQP